MFLFPLISRHHFQTMVRTPATRFNRPVCRCGPDKIICVHRPQRSWISSSNQRDLILFFKLFMIIFQDFLAFFQLDFARWGLNFGGILGRWGLNFGGFHSRWGLNVGDFLVPKLLFLLVLLPIVFSGFLFKNMNPYGTNINDIIIILILI